MPTGKVKWFHRKKGYGFITAESGEDVFVHYSCIEGSGFKVLDDGEEVEYEAEKDEKGIKARRVVRSKLMHR